MGLVFRAVRESDGEVVALKVMRFELIEDPVFGRRFEQEARAASEVREPHLVPVLEAGQADGRRFLASKYIAGRHARGHARRARPLELADTATYAQHVGAGLDALHKAGIVHRDLKPSNIIIDPTGTALLTDFGLAKGRAYTVLTKPGQVMGTLDYLAPELIKGEPATPATDIYALGCTDLRVRRRAAAVRRQGGHPGRPRARRRAAADALRSSATTSRPSSRRAVLSALAKDPARAAADRGRVRRRLAQTAAASAAPRVALGMPSRMRLRSDRRSEPIGRYERCVGSFRERDGQVLRGAVLWCGGGCPRVNSAPVERVSASKPSRPRGLPGHRPARARRHGLRLRGRAPAAQAQGGAEDARAGARRRRRLPRALHPRVADGRLDRPPEHHPDLRRGRPRGPRLHRHALRARAPTSRS